MLSLLKHSHSFEEEKTEEYLGCKWSCGSYDRYNKKCIYENKCIAYQFYFYGLVDCKKESGKDIQVLTKENAELNEQIEKIKYYAQEIYDGHFGKDNDYYKPCGSDLSEANMDRIRNILRLCNGS